MMLLLRLLLLALIIFIVYRIISFAASPVRRLEFAKRGNRFYLIDDRKNVRMNLLVTYKGFLFEGEKYVHPVDNKTVSRILLWPTEPYDTKLMEADVRFLEESLKAVYPNSKIDWKKS
ncbi:sigma-w pathway protein ysdB [Niallia taxi]|uniref:Sigma-w pathway protein ysdB n=1 Tax=Niallia taxi TaxID=2499688 RepID=A0A437KD46_9BACI|nr:sigma-w pathway protein ysdB [Niallia taxi]MCM3215118.1 sigma-w pathway protein ysdB [Niallia taxi]MDK8639419.1 sigma-w pathway protein ysdB [Niallia taxi]MED4037550.1 sigma-w pathway protein ysdB [Niallia taxi]MED4057515.1 sigma-w pathway protein ysdB [Niallia taxi]MED4117992.1 sigma-w pathway protein ysdB [Niallia taxi]